jgi:hypothetical protein
VGSKKSWEDENQKAIHEIAVKLRKKTDKQLVDTFQLIFDHGFENGQAKNQIPDGAIFINEAAKNKFLALVKITPGIGKAIYQKIEKIVI